MSTKKFQVFISSTYNDLIEERKKVQEVLLMADCIPAGMEAFVATTEEQFNVIKKVIDLCDYYVLIIAGRYGSINSQTGISYTEMEYDYAISQGIPVLVFVLDDSVSLPEKKKEKDMTIKEKLSKFKARAMTNRLVSIWKNCGDLAGQVAISIMKAKNEIVRPGWTRGGDLDQTKLLQQINLLQEENKKLTSDVVKLNTKIEELTAVNDDLEFEEKNIEIKYRTRGYSNIYKTSLTLKEIFKYVSIHMIDVSLIQSRVEDLIIQSTKIDCYEVLNREVLKQVCNQFKALKLMRTYSVEGKGLYYALTARGERLRDELNLFKKK